MLSEETLVWIPMGHKVIFWPAVFFTRDHPHEVERPAGK
jgi:hypothetical protein